MVNKLAFTVSGNPPGVCFGKKGDFLVKTIPEPVPGRIYLKPYWKSVPGRIYFIAWPWPTHSPRPIWARAQIGLGEWVGQGQAIKYMRPGTDFQYGFKYMRPGTGSGMVFTKKSPFLPKQTPGGLPETVKANLLTKNPPNHTPDGSI